MKQEESSALDHKNSPYDSLTGLYHLDTFKTNMKQYLKEQDSESHLALLYTDIAHFERINNLYGRSLADSLLLELSRAISQIDFGLRLYCRSVADHFVMLIKFEEKKRLDHALQQFCQEFNRLALERFPEAVPRLGIGAFVIYDTSEPIDDMVEKANAARKSLRGRSSVRVAYYNPIDFGKHRRAKELEKNMEYALAHKEFKVYLQPKYDLVTKKMVGAEALVRWVKDDGTMIYPDEFIPVFEKNGFIKQLDFYMLEQVFRLLSDWKERGRDLIPVSVNFSRITLLERDLFQVLTDMQKKYNIPARLVMIEITESIGDIERKVIESIGSKLREAGFRISLDDFGANYANMSILSIMKFDEVKLDKSLMDDLAANRTNQTVVKCIIDMCHSLQVECVAEGVENQEQLELLTSFGCTDIQGYYYSKPLEIEEFEKI